MLILPSETRDVWTDRRSAEFRKQLIKYCAHASGDASAIISPPFSGLQSQERVSFIHLRDVRWLGRRNPAVRLAFLWSATYAKTLHRFIYNCTLWAAFGIFLLLVSDCQCWWTMVILVILYYDYLLTLKTEIKWYWCSIDNQPRRFSLARVLFFLNRYVSIIGNIPVILPFFAPRFDSHRLEVLLLISGS